MRVFLNTQAPLTLPGMLSTAGHWDQSSSGIFQFLPKFSVRDLASVVTSRWRPGARGYFVGTRAFSSSNQLSTT